MKLVKTILAASVLTLSTGAMANDMYLDLTNLGGNLHDSSRFIGTADANSTTATFNEFGFSQILATSLYDMTDGTPLGSFYDTNIPAELTAAGIPASGTALDGITTVSLVMPDCPLGQCDIDALSPLVPPLATDNEGFIQTWDLQVAYHFDGTLDAAGPTYTGGTFDIYFNSLIDDTYDGLVISGVLTGSTLNAANLDLFFDITYALDDFLYIDSGSSFLDAADVIANGYVPTMVLDTNVNPPVPTADQLLLVGTNAVRQTTLDGSITAQVPVPGTLALLGLGLLGASVRRRRS